jgi:DNA-binding response OmpR family regulator
LHRYSKIVARYYMSSAFLSPRLRIIRPVIKQAHPSAGTSGEDFQPGQRSLRVLIVEDDRDSLLTLQLLLRDEGHDTMGATTGYQMWSLIAQFDPDAVLLDINLPDRNGYEVAREIRARFGDKRPTLIAVTAWNKVSDKMLSQLAGFDHHLGKPYDPNALLGLLNPLKASLRS